ncbi:MAG: hypothetical protein ACTS11_07955, partial [Roseicyclus sp.]
MDAPPPPAAEASREGAAAPAPSGADTAAEDATAAAPEALPETETAGQPEDAAFWSVDAETRGSGVEDVAVQDAADTALDRAAPAQAETETPVVAFTADETADFVPLSEAPPEEATAGPEADLDTAPSQARPEGETAIDTTGESSAIASDAAEAPATDARMPEAEPTAAEPDVDEAEMAQTAQAESAQTESAQAETAQDRDEDGRDFGGDGWRPEMRLFDWARPQDAAPVAPVPPAAEFESDTGDAGWPDASAAGALRELAAVRDAAPAEGADGAGDNVARFTPVFSRRSGTLTRVNEPAADEQATVEEAQAPAPDAGHEAPLSEAAREAAAGQVAQAPTDPAYAPAADAARETPATDAANAPPAAEAANE